MAQTNPIEHHGKQFQESVHKYETHHTETKKKKKKFKDDMLNYADRIWDFPTMASVYLILT